MLHHEFRIEGGTEPCHTCDLGIARFTRFDDVEICSNCLKRQAVEHLPWANELLVAKQTNSDENSPDETPTPSEEAASDNSVSTEQTTLL